MSADQNESNRDKKTNDTSSVPSASKDKKDNQIVNENKKSIVETEQTGDYNNSDSLKKHKPTWTKQEKISAISSGLSFLAIVIAGLALIQTTKSVNYTAQTIKNSKWKDSISLALAQIETRPVLQVSEIGFSNDHKNFDYQLINIGRLPAKVLSGRTKLILTNAPYKKEEIEKMNFGENVTYNSAVFGIAIMKLSFGEIVVPDSLLTLYKKGGVFFYFFGEFIYESYVTNEKFKLSFIYQIQPIPSLNVLALKNEDTTIKVTSASVKK